MTAGVRCVIDMFGPDGGWLLCGNEDCSGVQMGVSADDSNPPQR
jgi:hypothetical protein